MTEPLPIACSLDADDLERRLAAIAAIGAETRRRLEEIFAAEAMADGLAAAFGA